MNLVEQTDHLDAALGRLAEEFKDKAGLTALIAGLVTSVQELEGVFFDLLLLRLLDGAVGAQLDNLGRILVLPRGNAPDDQSYRLLLRARIKVIQSSGAPEQIIAVFFSALAGVGVINYLPGYPAGFVIRIDDNPLTWQVVPLLLFLQKATASGVNAILEWIEESEALAFRTEDHFTTVAIASTPGDLFLDVDGGTDFTLWPASGSLIIDQGTSNAETVVYSHISGTFIISSPGVLNVHAIGAAVQLVGGLGLGLGDTGNPATGGALAGALSAA